MVSLANARRQFAISVPSTESLVRDIRHVCVSYLTHFVRFCSFILIFMNDPYYSHLQSQDAFIVGVPVVKAKTYSVMVCHQTSRTLYLPSVI